MTRTEAALLRDAIERDYIENGPTPGGPRLIETALLYEPEGWVVRLTVDGAWEQPPPGVEVVVVSPVTPSARSSSGPENS